MAKSESSSAEEDIDEELAKMMSEMQRKQQLSGPAGPGGGGGSASTLVELEQAGAAAATSYAVSSDSLRKTTSFAVRPTPAATGLGIGLPGKRAAGKHASFASSPFGNAGFVSDEEIDLEEELGNSHGQRVPLLNT